MKGKRTAYGKSSSREKILEAALEVFGSKGFTAATTKEIARRAGVNEVTIFRQFKSKSDLFVAVMAEGAVLRDIIDHVQFEGDDLEDMIVFNMRTALAVLQKNRHMFMVVLGDAWRYPKSRKMLSEMLIQKGIDFIASMMEEMVKQGRMREIDPRVASRALMGMVQGYFITRNMLGGEEPDPAEDDAYIRGFASIFVKGVQMEGRVVE